jgi:hypothetical protein
MEREELADEFGAGGLAQTEQKATEGTKNIAKPVWNARNCSRAPGIEVFSQWAKAAQRRTHSILLRQAFGGEQTLARGRGATKFQRL